MANGKDERHNPNRQPKKWTVHIDGLDEPEVMDKARLIEYGRNISKANKGDDVPEVAVNTVEQAINNAIWAGDEFR